MRFCKRSLLRSVFLLTVLAACPGRAGADEARAAEVYWRALRSTSWVIVPLGNGMASTGTAWVVDRDQRLLVTNQHVVGNQGSALVLFPAYHNGQVIAERAKYSPNNGIPARVVATTVNEDLAVLQVDALPEGIEALPLAARSPEPGESVYSIGNPGASDALWVFTVGQVRAVYQKRWKTGGDREVVWRQARVVETSSPVNHGDSGGPLVNARGELVAVTSSGSATGNLVNWFIDASHVRTFLAEVRGILSPQSVHDFCAQGYRLQTAGRYDQAIVAYSAVIRRNPENTLASCAYNGRGSCWYAKKDYDTAIADFNEAIRLDPQDAAAYHNRGNAWYMKQEYDRAIDDHTRAIQLRPDHAKAFGGRADSYAAKGKAEAAIADYTRAIELDVQTPGADAFLSYNGRGVCYLDLNQYDAAVADFTAALELDRSKAFAWTNRGVAQFYRKHYEEALQDAVQALNLNPKETRGWGLVGDVAFVKGNYEGAVAAYTKAVQCDARYAYGYYWRAKAYQALGDHARAQSDYAQAASLDARYSRSGT